MRSRRTTKRRISESRTRNRWRHPLIMMGSAMVIWSNLISLVSAAPPPAEQHGLWQSKGYSSFFEIDAEGVTLIERSSIACFASHREENLEDLFGEELKITKKGKRRLVIKTSIAQTGIVLKRIRHAQLQRRCPELITEPVTDPELSFEMFWNIFFENYPFFERRGLDWQAVYGEFRGEVDQETTPEELLSTLRAMVAPLRDGHVSFTVGDEEVNSFEHEVVRQLFDECQDFTPPCSDPETYINQQLGRFLQILKESYLGGQTNEALDGQIFWGVLSSGVGYLFFGTAGDFSDDETTAGDLEVLEPILDDVFKDLESVPGFIVDLRFNQGGDDYVALALANRLTNKRRLVFKKSAFEKGRKTRTQRAFIKPTGKPSYQGPVAVLTSSLTASAAEILTLGLRALPDVKLIGAATAGEFSDQLSRTLPIGFGFNLSNEIYKSADRKIFEAVGIPPDIEMTFLPLSDRDQGKDSILEEAIFQLSTDF